MKLKHGHFYIDNIFHIIIVFEEEKDNMFWFYCPEEDSMIGYYESELKVIERY